MHTTIEDWADYFQLEPLGPGFEWMGKLFESSGWFMFRDKSTWKFERDGKVTRRHPMHDRLRDIYLSCRGGDDLEICTLKISIMLNHRDNDDPIFSPKSIFSLSEIFRITKLNKQSISILRDFLKSCETDLNRGLEISRSSVSLCQDALAALGEDCHEHAKFTAADLGRGSVQCVECIEKFPATVFCHVCADALCMQCFMNMHSRGSRQSHAFFKVEVCQVCLRKPARLYLPGNLSGNFCSECYATKYFKTLPPSDRVNLPRTISFPDLDFPGFQNTPKGEDDWFPFYDSTGSCYLFNFETSETKRPKVDR